MLSTVLVAGHCYLSIANTPSFLVGGGLGMWVGEGLTRQENHVFGTRCFWSCSGTTECGLSE